MPRRHGVFTPVPDGKGVIELRIVELCGKDGCCPRVELDDQEVRIGEPGNQVRLSLAEWQTLRAKVLQGDL